MFRIVSVELRWHLKCRSGQAEVKKCVKESQDGRRANPSALTLLLLILLLCVCDPVAARLMLTLLLIHMLMLLFIVPCSHVLHFYMFF